MATAPGNAPAAAPAAAPATALDRTRGRVLADRVEIAASFMGRFMGLMGRASLPAGDGLWLSGGNGIHMFFMRFPIDAVFLSRADSAGVRRIVGLSRRLPAWTGLVPFVRGADGVLELPAGAADGCEVGDEVVLG